MVPLRLEPTIQILKLHPLWYVDSVLMPRSKADLIIGSDIGRAIVITASIYERISDARVSLLRVQALLEFDLEDELDRHYLLLRELVTVVVMPVQKRISLLVWVRNFLLAAVEVGLYC